jgi:hypothetical protein
MAVERDDHRPESAFGGEATHLGDDRLVTEVNTVVRADGDD